mmetsp:Transcript_36855/g.86075  ORF Transcript_36855/g.86075 Transcript_36855/m.86075 type:complete len:714 (-) Transcript_36855:166-2307(-)
MPCPATATPPILSQPSPDPMARLTHATPPPPTFTATPRPPRSHPVTHTATFRYLPAPLRRNTSPRFPSPPSRSSTRSVCDPRRRWYNPLHDGRRPGGCPRWRWCQDQDLPLTASLPEILICSVCGHGADTGRPCHKDDDDDNETSDNDSDSDSDSENDSDDDSDNESDIDNDIDNNIDNDNDSDSDHSASQCDNNHSDDNHSNENDSDDQDRDRDYDHAPVLRRKTRHKTKHSHGRPRASPRSVLDHDYGPSPRTFVPDRPSLLLSPLTAFSAPSRAVGSGPSSRKEETRGMLSPLSTDSRSSLVRSAAHGRHTVRFQTERAQDLLSPLTASSGWRPRAPSPTEDRHGPVAKKMGEALLSPLTMSNAPPGSPDDRRPGCASRPILFQENKVSPAPLPMTPEVPRYDKVVPLMRSASVPSSRDAPFSLLVPSGMDPQGVGLEGHSLSPPPQVPTEECSYGSAIPVMHSASVPSVADAPSSLPVPCRKGLPSCDLANHSPPPPPQVPPEGCIYESTAPLMHSTSVPSGSDSTSSLLIPSGMDLPSCNLASHSPPPPPQVPLEGCSYGTTVPLMYSASALSSADAPSSLLVPSGANLLRSTSRDISPPSSPRTPPKRCLEATRTPPTPIPSVPSRVAVETNLLSPPTLPSGAEMERQGGEITPPHSARGSTVGLDLLSPLTLPSGVGMEHDGRHSPPSLPARGSRGEGLLLQRGVE